MFNGPYGEIPTTEHYAVFAWCFFIASILNYVFKPQQKESQERGILSDPVMQPEN